MLSMIVKPLLGASFRPAAGGDAPAAQLRCLAFLAAVALRDAVAHVPVVREPEHDPVAPVVDRLGGRDHDVAAGVGHDSVPAAFEPASLDAGAVDLAERDAELAAVLDDAVADDDAVVAPLVAAAANADPLTVAVADAARVDDELDGPAGGGLGYDPGRHLLRLRSREALVGVFERSSVSRWNSTGPDLTLKTENGSTAASACVTALSRARSTAARSSAPEALDEVRPGREVDRAAVVGGGDRSLDGRGVVRRSVTHRALVHDVDHGPGERAVPRSR